MLYNVFKTNVVMLNLSWYEWFYNGHSKWWNKSATSSCMSMFNIMMRKFSFRLSEFDFILTITRFLLCC